MDYEKKYKEAMEAMVQWVAPCHTKKQLDVLKKSVFPELAESEDERIRKEIVDYFTFDNFSSIQPYTREQSTRFLAWLEKQKEQKPAEKITDAEMKESMDAVTDFKVFAADLAKTFNITHKRDIDWHNFCAGLLTYLGRNKPVEWSEEDEKTLDDLLWLCDRWDEGKNNVLPSKETITKVRKMLKSLLPQK